jgi:hypothetical protein
MGSQVKTAIRSILLALSLAVSPVAIAEAAREHKHKEAVVGVSSLDVFGDGNTIHLLIATQQPGAPAKLEYLRSPDAGENWSPSVAVGEGQPTTIAKRGMDAQIAALGDSLVAVWPTAGTDKMGRGPMVTAISSDGGKTWRPGPHPADDNLTTGHSFIDIAADASGAFHLVWLDGREGAGKGLRYARSADGGATWSANQTLDPDTCECCWNAFALAPDNRVSVLYRRKDPRDMAVINSTDAGWTWSDPVAVGAFNWTITACPHVGGAMAFSGTRTAHAAVWSARDTQAHGVYVLHSRDAGVTWSVPQRVGPPEASRPDLCVDHQGELCLVYDAYVDGGQGVFAVSAADGGKRWSSPRRLSRAESSATHPRIVATPSGPRVFWTERQPGKPPVWLSATP